MTNEMPPPGEWTDDMGQISGFGRDGDPGGWRYENCCRAMLRAGLTWLDAHPDADPRFHGYKHITGILIEDNDDAKALSAAVLAPAEEGGGASGAMHQAACSHALFIKANGWAAYVQKMREREARDDIAEDP